ncbi:MAG: hypothetical protein DRO96_00840 [Candidatus Aenigmatarchaeota archaeon]|nr:MAG: hypothetical protein B6U68_00495 [Candidatus Aenigmarchaeota archaeon ex4484_14]RLI97376.1 MAG: hypothetical protein DRO96_00840 [Candidatus Aenigmarchaeota archaeon]
MMQKRDLEETVEKVLEKNNFNVIRHRGCFDLAAKRRKILLLKILVNVDSFLEYQSENLKIVSKSVCAFPLLIGIKTNREKLKESMIYERFGITTMNPQTLDNIFSSFSPEIFRKRGGMFVEIYPEKLRMARESLGLTQEELAKKVGTTKKTIYEHEKTSKKMSRDFAVKLEKILKRSIIKPFLLEDRTKETEIEKIEKKPKTRFEINVSKEFERIGFDTDFVEQTPFNLILKNKKRGLVLTRAEPEGRCKNLDELTKISEFFKSMPLLVTKSKTRDKDVPIPILEKTELHKFKTAEELIEFLRSF